MMEYIFGYSLIITLSIPGCFGTSEDYPNFFKGRHLGWLYHITQDVLLKVPYALTTAKACDQRLFVWLLTLFLKHVFFANQCNLLPICLWVLLVSL